MSDRHKLGYTELVAKYPEIPHFIIRKLDTALRGVVLTEKAFERAREENGLYDFGPDLGTEKYQLSIGAALFRDGTQVRGLDSLALKSPIVARKGDPYVLDVVDDKLWLLDGEEPVEEIDLVPTPAFYGKKTSRGTPMTKVIRGGLNVIGINVFGFCQFWRDKIACRYCGSVQNFRMDDRQTRETLEDLYESVTEALKEEGRYTSFALISGSDPRGDRPYDNEVNEHVKVLETIQRAVGGNRKFTARLIASAFPVEQQIRLKEAGATGYEPHLEVWDKKLFEWICPGKAKYYGQDYWIENAIKAVDVFGRGNVCSQFVAAAELAKPHGFKTIDEALASTLEGAEFFAQNGVTTTANILRLAKGSHFYAEQQDHPPLEYSVRLTKGLHEIRRKYRLGVDLNDYRRCAIHPDSDLARIDAHHISTEPVKLQEVVNG